MSCETCKTCVSGTCSERQEATETKDIFTPFWFTIIPRNGMDGTHRNEPNYEPYDLFCLMTKISPHIKAMGLRRDKDSAWYPRFIAVRSNPDQIKFLTGKYNFEVKEMDEGETMYVDDIGHIHRIDEDRDVMVITVQIYDGSDFVPVDTEEMRKEIQDMVDTQLNVHKGYVIVLHDRFPIFYKGEHINHTWFKMILRLIPIPPEVVYPETQLDGRKFGLEAIYDSGAIYAKLNGELSYEKVYRDLHVTSLDNILQLYRRGCIKLGMNDDVNGNGVSDIDIKFINDWQLTEYMDGYYIPKWINRWIAPQPSIFLMRRRAGIPYIAFDISLNNVVRHYVTMRLKKHNFRFVFCDNEVLIWVRNIVRADLAHAQVIKGISRSRGSVKTDKDFRFDYMRVGDREYEETEVEEESISVANLSKDVYIIPVKGRQYVEYTDLYVGTVRSVVD